MEVNLEKIELVKDRTGCTYADAKEALEKAEGSVVDAIIEVEEKMNREYDSVSGGSLKDSPIFAKMKEIVEKGNVSRIIISKEDRTIVNFPLTAGVIGAVLVPWSAILGIVAALGTQCSIDFVDDKGEVIDINGKAIGFYDKAKGIVKKGVDTAQAKLNEKGVDTDGAAEKINEVADAAADKVDELKGIIEKAVKKTTETIKKLSDDVTEAYSKADSSEVVVEEDFNKAAEEEFKDEEDL